MIDPEFDAVTFADGDNTPPPTGFRLGSPNYYFDITTTASFSGPVTVCINYTGSTFGNENHLELLHGDGEATITIDSLDLVEGTYKVDVAVHRLDGYPYDYHRLLYTFRVKSRTKDVGIYRPRHSWRFSDAVRLSRPSGEQP